MHVDNVCAATRKYALSFQTLRGEHTDDVVIIGSGITGVSAVLE